jgi:hypothetical protein
MLAGIAICHCQSDFDKMKIQHTAIRILCFDNGIDSSTVLFCKQEHLLASIKNQYCQVNLYNDAGYQIESMTKDGFIEMSQIEFLFKNLNQINPQHCNSSKSLELEQESWVDGNGFSLKKCYVIVCYWSKRKLLQEQFYRMQELQKLKTHFSHISIRLVFINQDFIP